MMKFYASFHAPDVRLALSRNCRWSRSTVPAFTAGIALVWLLLAGTAGAADVIWDGSTSTSWNDGTNWTSNSATEPYDRCCPIRQQQHRQLEYG